MHGLRRRTSSSRGEEEQVVNGIFRMLLSCHRVFHLGTRARLRHKLDIHRLFWSRLLVSVEPLSASFPRRDSLLSMILGSPRHPGTLQAHLCSRWLARPCIRSMMWIFERAGSMDLARGPEFQVSYPDRDTSTAAMDIYLQLQDMARRTNVPISRSL